MQKKWLLVFSLLAPLTAFSRSAFIPNEAEQMTFTDFENATWASPDWDQGPGWGKDANYNIAIYDIPLPDPLLIHRTKDPSGTGTSVLYWPILKDQHSEGRYESKEVGTREAWAEYKIYIPDSVNYNIGADQDDCNKLPGFTGGGEGSGNYGSDDGQHGWSARTGWKVDLDGTFRIGYYIYHMNRPSGQAGEWASWNTTLQRNRWYTISEHVRVNTLDENGAVADGVLEAWVDGNLVFSKNTYRFSDIPDFSKVRSFWLTVYFGGNKKAPHNMGFYFDDLSVYRKIDPPAAVLESIYPNPAQKSETVYLKLTVNEAGPYHIQLTSITGAQVIYETQGIYDLGDYVLPIPLQFAQSGIYVPWLSYGTYKKGSSGSERILNRAAKLIISQ